MLVNSVNKAMSLSSHFLHSLISKVGSTEAVRIDQADMEGGKCVESKFTSDVLC